MLTRTAFFLHAANCSLAEEMARRFIIGRRDHDRVGAREDAVKVVHRHDLVRVLVRQAAAGDGDDPRAERAQQPADLATDRAKADDRDGAGRRRGQLRREGAIPGVALLIGKDGRDAALHGQQQRDRMHRDGGRERRGRHCIP